MRAGSPCWPSPRGASADRAALHAACWRLIVDDMRPPAALWDEWRLLELARARAELIHNRAACAQQKAPKKQKVAKEDKEPNAKKIKKADEDEKGEPKEKRPPGAYFIFSDEKRKEVRAVFERSPSGAPACSRVHLCCCTGASAPCLPRGNMSSRKWVVTQPWSSSCVRPRRRMQRNRSLRRSWARCGRICPRRTRPPSTPKPPS